MFIERHDITEILLNVALNTISQTLLVNYARFCNYVNFTSNRCCHWSEAGLHMIYTGKLSKSQQSKRIIGEIAF
jgi:hypothetical protein